MADEVKIPVQVVGADAAQAELKQTGQAVAGVGADAATASTKQSTAATAAAAAGEKQAGATDKVGGAQKKTNEQLVDFHRKGEVAVKQILAQFNPSLAQSADLLFDLGEGLSMITGPLLAFAAAGVGIGLVAQAFEDVARKAKEAEDRIRAQTEALKEQREEGAKARGDVTDQAAKVGLFGIASQVQSEAAEKQRSQGLPIEIGRNLAIARELAKQGGEPFSDDEFLAGVMANAAEPIEFERGTDTGRAENLKRIRATLVAGSQESAKAALRAFLFEKAPVEVPQAPGVGADVLDPLDAEIDKTAKRRALSRTDVAILDRVARAMRGGELLPEKVRALRDRGMLSDSDLTPELRDQLTRLTAGKLLGVSVPLQQVLESGGVPTDEQEVPGTGLKLGDILREAGAAIDNAGGAGGGAAPRIPSTQPVNITIHNEFKNEKNIATNYEFQSNGGGTRFIEGDPGTNN